ncbi:hypothetical protein SLEP1_g17506 [Rubroshorea leprosula]|uniref:Uncharacterized protein n=1 Tax=Rubroshorea leprosula TaxID=152421 RepID=A0AAV5J0E4_9ROSI|nr:hypothetical protein SLEP1_g17506 [Rubroshorea leprosula]
MLRNCDVAVNDFHSGQGMTLTNAVLIGMRPRFCSTSISKVCFP